MLVFAEDPLVRSALLMTLPDQGPQLSASAAVADFAEQVRLLRPDVALCDLGPGFDENAGKKSLSVVTSLELPVLALVATPEGVVEAIAAGASGAITRDVGAEGLAALVALGRGLAVFDQSFLASLIPGESGAHLLNGRDELREPLTDREAQVLVLLAEGLSNRAIAESLKISEHTAKFHVNSVLGKLGAQKRVEAVVRAARLGIIDL